MKWDERIIATAISRQVLRRSCVLLVDRCSWTGNECDVLAVTKDLRIIDVEIKISRGDLKADAKKDKWWHRKPWPLHETPRERRLWPHSVWKHYYAMPADIWDDGLLSALPSPMSGVILMRSQRNGVALADVVRRCRANPQAGPIDAAAVLDIARLANLRMWDAYDALARVAAERNGAPAPPDGAGPQQGQQGAPDGPVADPHFDGELDLVGGGPAQPLEGVQGPAVPAVARRGADAPQVDPDA